MNFVVEGSFADGVSFNTAVNVWLVVGDEVSFNTTAIVWWSAPKVSVQPTLFEQGCELQRFHSIRL